jgi:hypothetical protein
VLYFVTAAGFKALFFIVICISIFCEGGHFALVPSHCGYAFGPDLGIEVYSYLFACFGLSSLTGSIIAKYLITTPETYMYLFLIAAGLNLLTLVLLYFYKPDKQNR